MTVLTIDTDNKNDLAMAKLIAKKNGWLLKKAISKKRLLPKQNGKKIAKLLQEFADMGGPSSFPKNAAAWQRKIRKDKTLSGR